jgi:hypothetical protein
LNHAAAPWLQLHMPDGGADAELEAPNSQHQPQFETENV